MKLASDAIAILVASLLAAVGTSCTQPKAPCTEAHREMPDSCQLLPTATAPTVQSDPDSMGGQATLELADGAETVVRRDELGRHDHSGSPERPPLSTLLFVEPQSFDLGEVEPRQRLTGAMTLLNRTDRPIEIRIVPFNRTMRFEIGVPVAFPGARFKLGPGEETEVVVSLLASHYAGAHVQKFAIVAEHSVMMCEIKFVVRH